MAAFITSCFVHHRRVVGASGDPDVARPTTAAGSTSRGGENSRPPLFDRRRRRAQTVSTSRSPRSGDRHRIRSADDQTKFDELANA